MTIAVSCHDCDAIAYPPLDAEGSGGRTEIAAVRLAFEHVKETGHQDVYVIPGCYYTGDGERPEGFDEGITLEDCVTPPRGKLVDDLEFAIDTLHDQADRFERWADLDENQTGEVDGTRLQADVVADNLRERGDLLERKLRERRDTDIDSESFPVRPKADLIPEDVPQPRSVEWGHLSQVRGSVSDDRVRVERQKRRHHFQHGTEDRGPPISLFEGNIAMALDVYRALDALFDGGALEADTNA